MTHRPDRDELHETALALPFIQDGETLTDTEALAVLQDTTSIGSSLEETARRQAKSVTESLESELHTYTDREGRLVLPRSVLQSIITRSVLTGTAQAAYNIGRRLADARELEELFAADTSEEREIPPESNSSDD